MLWNEEASGTGREKVIWIEQYRQMGDLVWNRSDKGLGLKPNWHGLYGEHKARKETQAEKTGSSKTSIL